MKNVKRTSKKNNGKVLDWNKELESLDFRDNLIYMVKRFLGHDAVCVGNVELLTVHDNTQDFLLDFYAFVPDAIGIIGISVDADKLATRKSILALANDKNENESKNNKINNVSGFNFFGSQAPEARPDLLLFCLAMMHKGVSSLNYTYTSGTDQVDPDSDIPNVEFLKGFSCDDEHELCDWAAKKSGCNDPMELFWHICDHSGAGVGTVYQTGYTIDLFNFGITEDEWVEIVDEDDEREE